MTNWQVPDVSHLSPEEKEEAKALANDPAFRALTYLVKHGIPYKLAEAFTPDEVAFIASAIQRVAQDAGPVRKGDEG